MGSGQGTHWPSVPERQPELKRETLTNAISELGTEIFLFSLSTAGTISFCFSLYIISSARPAFELQCTKHYIKELTIQHSIDYIGDREKRYNHNKKECLDYGRPLWRRQGWPFCHSLEEIALPDIFKLWVKINWLLFKLHRRSKISQITQLIFPGSIFSYWKSATFLFLNHLGFYKGQVE